MKGRMKDATVKGLHEERLYRAAQGPGALLRPLELGSNTRVSCGRCREEPLPQGILLHD